MTPKNDKARKAWLAGLKDGDEGVHADSAGGFGIGRVRRTEIGIRLDLDFSSGLPRRAYFTAITGKGMADNNTTGWLIPLTDEVRAEIARRKRALEARKRLSGRYYYGGFSDEQVLAAEAILWPEVKP